MRNPYTQYVTLETYGKALVVEYIRISMETIFGQSLMQH